MKKTFFYIAIVGFLFSCSIEHAHAQTNYAEGMLSFKLQDSYPVEFNVDRDNTVSIADLPFLLSLAHEFGIYDVYCPLKNFRTAKTDRIINVKFDSIKKIDLFIRKLSNLDIVEYAEKKEVAETFWTPNDPYYTKNYDNRTPVYNFRWHLDLINAEAAWDIRRASSEIKVAVVDDAIWGEHPDLQIPSNLQYNCLERRVGNSAPPDSINQDEICLDKNNCPTLGWSHGTHCAGLVGAVTNNGIGVAAIGGGVTLLSVSAAHPIDGKIYYGPEGIDWAVAQKAQVVSMSFGTADRQSAELKTAVEAAYAKGVILVAAAGNEGDKENPINYPAANPKTISVASVDSDKKLSNFSEYGNWVNIAAPGGCDTIWRDRVNRGYRGSIFSTMFSLEQRLGRDLGALNFEHYDVSEGTSMACPVTAGLCGLLLTRDPNLTFDAIKYYLQSTSQIRKPFTGRDIQSGVIDAVVALTAVGDSMPTVNFVANMTEGQAPLSVTFTDNSTLGHGTLKRKSWYLPGSDTPESTVANPTVIYNTPGIYNAGLVVENNNTRKNYKNEDYFLKDSIMLGNYINVKVPTGTDTLFSSKDTVEINSYVNNTALFNIISSAMDWKIVNPNSWLSYTVDSLDKTGNGVVSLKVKVANFYPQIRYANLRAINSLQDTVTIVIKQNAADTLFKVSKSIFTAPVNGITGNAGLFEISSNLNWSVVSSTVPNWITLSKTSGSGTLATPTVANVLTVLANTGFDSRTAVIQFQAGTISKYITVNQAGNTSTLTVDPTTVQLKNTANDTTKITITTNYAWEVKNIPSWATVEPSSGVGNATVSIITKSENAGTTNRTATLTVVTTGTTILSQDITLTQPFSSIADDININNIKIYPNPLHDKLYIENGSTIVKEYHITDVTGRTLLVQPQKASNVEINFEGFAKGTYLIKILTKDGNQYVKKVVKQ